MFQDSEIGAVTTGGPFGHPPASKYEKLTALAKEVPPATTVVVHPCDETSLRGAVGAAELGIIVPILVGPGARISAVAQKHGIDIARYELVDAPHSEAAAAKAVELIRESRGELLMKGSLHTDELMRAVTSATTGLRTARRISHVFIMDVPTHTEASADMPSVDQALLRFVAHCKHQEAEVLARPARLSITDYHHLLLVNGLELEPLAGPIPPRAWRLCPPRALAAL